MSYMDALYGPLSQWTNAQAPPSYTPTWSPQALGQQNQNVVNNLYGGGANAGFGAQTDYYSGLGAAYGRATGGFGGYGGGGGGGGGAGDDSGIAGWGSQPMSSAAPSQPQQPQQQPGGDANNPFNVPPHLWNSMSGGDRTAFNRQMGMNTSPSPYGPLYPGPASPSAGKVQQGPALLPATPNWTDQQRASGTDMMRNKLAETMFNRGTTPVQGETGWVNLPQSWYNQTGTPLAKQMYDPLQQGGGFSGNGSIGGTFPANTAQDWEKLYGRAGGNS